MDISHGYLAKPDIISAVLNLENAQVRVNPGHRVKLASG